MIPKNIFQTHSFRFSALPPAAKRAIQTWKDLNPSHTHIYMDDDAMYDYIRSLGGPWYEIAQLCKVKVMVADLWRYLVIYTEGGIYSDVDTIDIEPAETWLPANKQFVTAPEDAFAICQWTFAAIPGHPVLKAVLDEIESRFLHPEGPDYSNPHFVHDLTGPALWTDGILKGLQARGRPNFAEAGYYNNLRMAKATGFHLHHSPLFKGAYVDHLYQSVGNWPSVQTDTWKMQRDKVLDEVRYKHREVQH